MRCRQAVSRQGNKPSGRSPARTGNKSLSLRPVNRAERKVRRSAAGLWRPFLLLRLYLMISHDVSVRFMKSAGSERGGGDAVSGAPAHHIPVLGHSALDFLNVRDGGIYIDGTFGAGGYSRAILAAADCKVIAIDRDPRALALGAELS